MAKKDPSLESPNNFDDELFSDLDRWDSEFNNFNVDSDGIDSDNERKPVSKLQNVTRELKNAGKKASAGAAVGIATRIQQEMPEVKNVADSAINFLGEATALKNDTVTKLRPLLNQTKIVSRQLLNQSKDFVPKKLYDSLAAKLDRSIEEKYKAPSRSEQRAQETATNLNEIFKAQNELRYEEKKDEFVRDTINNQLAQNRHGELAKLLGDIRNQNIFNTQFTRSTFTAYLRKDLELKYRHLFLTEDLLEVTRITSQMMEKKLDAIRHNTSLPDSQKIHLLEIGRRNLREKMIEGLGGQLSNYGKNILANIKSEFIDPALSGLGDANDILEGLATGLEMKNDFEGPTNVKRTAASWISSQVGGLFGKTIGKRLLKKLSPDAKAALSSAMSGGTKGVALLLDAIRNGEIEVPGIEEGGFLHTLLTRILPTVDRDTAHATNDAFENPTGAAQITNKFVTTVEEIIPGYLSMQTQYLERLATALAGNVSASRMTFDFKTHKFDTIDNVRQNIQDTVIGKSEDRAAIVKANVNKIRTATQFASEQVKMDFKSHEQEISQVMMNAAEYGKFVPMVLSMQNLRDMANAQNDASGKVIFPNDAMKAVFRGIKNPQAVASILVSIFTDKDGNVAPRPYNAFKERVMFLMSNVIDNYRKDFFHMLDTYGADVAGDMTESREDSNDLYFSRQMMQDRWKDITQEQLNAVDDSKYDPNTGLLFEQKTLFEESVEGAHNLAKDIPGAIKSGAKKLDSLLTRGADAAGVGKQYRDIKSTVKSNFDAVAKYLSDTKTNINKLGTQQKQKLYVIVYDWLTQQEDPIMRDIRNLIFTRRKTRREKLDPKMLADLLANVPGLHAVLKRIVNGAKDSPYLSILYQLLPEACVILGKMSDEEVAMIRNAPDPVIMLVQSVGDDKFETTYKVGENIVDLGNFYNEETTDIGDYDSYREYTGSEPVGTYDTPTVFANGSSVMGEAGVETIVPWNNSPAAKDAFAQAAAFHAPELNVAGASNYDAEALHGTGFKFAKGGTAETTTGKRVNPKAQKSFTESMAERINKTLNDVKAYFNKAHAQDEKQTQSQARPEQDTTQNAAKGKTAGDGPTQTSPPPNDSFFAKTSATFDRMFSSSSKMLSSLKSLNTIAQEQLSIQQNILLYLLTSSGNGDLGEDIDPDKKIDKKTIRNLKAALHKRFPSMADRIGSAAKWIGRRAKNIAWDAPTAVLGFGARQVADVARGTFTNVTPTLYLKPLGDEPIDLEHPLITKDHWKAGIYADENLTQRIYSASDISGPVWDSEGKPLVSPQQYVQGLVDHNGKRYDGLSSGLGRAIHHTVAGAGRMGTKVLDKVVTNENLRKIGNFAADIARSPFNVVGGILKKFVDVGIIDTDGKVKILVYASDFRNGLVQFANGKLPKTSYDIDEPLFWTNVKENGEKAGQTAISNEDIRNGLVDNRGKPVNKFSRLAGAGLRLGGELAGKALGAVFGKSTDIISFGLGLIKTGVHKLWESKYPYIDVFVPDENGDIDATKPRLLGVKIRDGMYIFEDGKPVTSAYRIEGAVKDRVTGNTLITSEEAARGVYDIKGRKLTAFAGRSIIGKAAALATSAAWKITKGVSKFALKTGIKALKGIGKVGKSIKWILSNATVSISDAFGWANNVFQEALATVFRSNTVRRQDIEELITARLDTIISIIRGKSPADAGSGDASAAAAEEAGETTATTEEGGTTQGSKVKRKKSFFEKVDDLQQTLEKKLEQADKSDDKDRNVFADKLESLFAKYFGKNKVAGDVDGDGDREGSYQDQMQKKKEREAAKAGINFGGESTKESWMEKLLNRFGTGAVGAEEGGDNGGFNYIDRGGDGKGKGKGTTGKKPGLLRRGVSKLGNLINKIPGGKYLTGAASKIFSVGGGLLRSTANLITSPLSLLARGAMAIPGAIAGAGSTLAGAAAALAPAAIPLAITAAAGYGVYKLYRWWKDEPSDVENTWGETRYKAYGLDWKKHREILKDFEEDAMEDLMDNDDNIDEDALEELAEDLGLIQDGDDKKTIEKKIKFITSWYRNRFQIVLAAYIRTVKIYIHDYDTDDPDDIEPDEIDPKEQKNALKRFEQEYSPYLQKGSEDLVPTLEGYQAATGEKQKAAEDKAKDKASGKESALAKATKEEQEKAAKEQDAKNKEAQDAQKEQEKSLLDRVKDAAKNSLAGRTVSVLSTFASKAKNFFFGDSDETANKDRLTAIADGAKSLLQSIPGAGLVTTAASGIASLFGNGAPQLDLSNINATNIPDGGVGDLGSYVQKFESGSRGPAAIGYDGTGGTSYGTYQIASRSGTMKKFLEYAKTSGGEFGTKLAEELSKGGNLDTGSKNGYGPEIWRQFAAVDGGKALHKLEQGFIKQTHYDPAYKGINPKARALLDSDRGLREALWSTSIQHGPGSASKGNGAVGIFNKTYKEGMTAEEWLKAIYEKRGTQFGSSSPQVRNSVLNRYKNELPIVLGLSKTSVASPAANGEITTETGVTGGANSSSSGYASGTDYSSTGGGNYAESPVVTAAKNIQLGAVDTGSLKIQSGVDFANLHPLLQQRISALGKAYETQFGEKIQINSGKRSMAQQTALYQKYGPGKAAKPNPYSPHISGVALDANSSQMNKADSSGLLDQFGLWRPLKNGLGRTKPEAWHVELMGSRDAKSKRITEATLQAINATGSNPNVGEEGKPTDPAAQDTSADGTESQSLDDQKKEQTAQQEASQPATTTISSSTTSSPSSSSASTSAATSVMSSQPSSSVTTENPSAAPADNSTAAAATASSVAASTPATTTAPTTTTTGLGASPTVETSTPLQTNQVNSSEVAASEQLQEVKITNQLLTAISETLKLIANKPVNAPETATTMKEQSTAVSNTTNSQTTTSSLPNLDTLTQAFSNALNQAFSPGAPAYALLSGLSSNPTANATPGSSNSRNYRMDPGINVSKSNKYRSLTI